MITKIKDIGEYLIENNVCKASLLTIETLSRITTIEENIFAPEQVRKMTKEEIRVNCHKNLGPMKYWD